MFKSLFLFNFYRKKINKLSSELRVKYNIRIDNIFRLYTVLNIPEDVVEVPYNLRKSDIDNISRTFISDYNISLSQFLNSNGLTELYKVYDMKKVDKYSYLLIYGYSLFNTKKVFTRLIFIFLLLIIISIGFFMN